MQLKKFEVTNFKGFKDCFTFDLSKIKDYAFHLDYIQNHIIEKALIYGKNGVGKSNLGYALFDITLLLGNLNHIHYHNEPYLNLDSSLEYATFSYEFVCEDHIITYTYKKENYNLLLAEEIQIDGITRLSYKRNTPNEVVVIPANEYCKNDFKLSSFETMLSYMEHPLILKLVDFIKHMRWYRFNFQKMDEQKSNPKFDQLIIQNDCLSSFQKFLEENGISYHLISKSIQNSSQIYVHYQKEDVPFLEVASSGTKSLYYYFYFSLLFKDTTFLFLDEFDALYHYETAETILNLLFQNKDMQIFVVSHNTYLMKNALIRPDCCFLLNDGKITSLAYLTDKEIQETHNLEKMYRNGAFKE